MTSPSSRGLRARVDRALERLLVALLSLLVIDVIWQVASRLVLRAPSSFTDEIARFLFMWVGLLGAAYAAGQRLHLAIDLAARRAGPRYARGLDLLGRAALIGFAGVVMVLGGARLVLITLQLDQRSATLQIPLGWVYTAVPLSGLLIAYYAVAAPPARATGDAEARP